MIRDFINFLSNNNIEYKFTNGYENLEKSTDDGSDYDILFRKVVFLEIEELIERFGKEFEYHIVQRYHQGQFAKNFFLYDLKKGSLLNLDLYGELARHHIKILDEEEVFSAENKFENISILQPQQEFIQYFIKKVDKKSFDQQTYISLKGLFDQNKEGCGQFLDKFFIENSEAIKNAFDTDQFAEIEGRLSHLKKDFCTLKNSIKESSIKNFLRIIGRIVKPTGIAISFLGPDGSGKSTIIDGLLKESLPFRRNDYFHLKPIPKKKGTSEIQVTNPHEQPPYPLPVSYAKLLFFMYQFNFGWLTNIWELKIRSSLVIFDRYYDDIMADPKRYRLNKMNLFAKLIRVFIPKPDIYFILTAEANIIHQRKQEVDFAELESQIKSYRNLADNKRYYNINVNRNPDLIVREVKQILMNKMHERY